MRLAFVCVEEEFGRRFSRALILVDLVPCGSYVGSLGMLLHPLYNFRFLANTERSVLLANVASKFLYWWTAA